jgi:DNA mismatch repair protein MutS2
VISPPDIQTETLDLLEWSRLCQQVSTFAATKLGRIAAQSLVIPAHPEQSLTLLAQTREIYELELRLSNGLPFEGIQDIGEALERSSHGGLLSGEELLQIATTLNGMRQVRRVIDAQDPAQVPTLATIVSDLRTYPELEQQIHHCIDERGRVNDRASEKLTSIRENLRSQRDTIQQKLQNILHRHSNAIQEQVITQRDGRFLIPVKASHRDVISGIIHDTSGSGATLYVEPHSVVEANNRLRQLLRQEQAEEERICQQLSEQVATVTEDLERLLAIATTLDLAAARARYSLWLQGNPPHLINVGKTGMLETGVELEQTIVLRELRHPLLVWQQRHEQGTPVVPIDLHIAPHLRVIAITGPNTGGKTVTLKTLGLAMLMAKVGLFIPAREPVELPWFDLILADIGDEQSLQQSLSTFSGHIKRIGRILAAIEPSPPQPPTPNPKLRSHGISTTETLNSNNPKPQTPSPELPSTPNPEPRTPNSLVLLDEVGAGTDPSEGSALAIALLKYLADRARLTIATTHFGELKALKYQDERFENASVEFDDQSLSPTYRLLWGIPGRSNALTIAQRLGLNGTVVEQARHYVSSGASAEINEVIAGLEAQRRHQETKAKDAAQVLAKAEQFYEAVSRKSALLEAREQSLKQQQEQAVQAAISQAKAEIAQVIRKLQQGPQTAQKAQEATVALEEIAAQQLPIAQPQKQANSGFRPKVGDRVKLTTLGNVAEVITCANEAGELMVRFGLMKMTVSLRDIESLQGEKAQALEPKRPEVGKPEPKQEASKQEAPLIRTSHNTIDLRGSRVADAEIEIDRKLAEASGAVWIIHGHGTGKLRKGIQEFLRQHSRVDRFEPAAQEDGGTGVTVAYLKG